MSKSNSTFFFFCKYIFSNKTSLNTNYLTFLNVSETSTVLPAWLLSMWLMTTIHPPLKSYRQNPKPVRSQQLLEGNNNINFIIHDSPVPKSNKIRSNQYVDLPVENQITPEGASGGGVEVTTFRYPRLPNTYSWTKSELKTYIPSKFAGSQKSSVNDINNNLVINSKLNEIPGSFGLKSSTTTEKIDPFNNFNNILLNSKLFKHFNAITSYSPPPAKNLTPKDLNNIMTNSQSTSDMLSPMNDTTYMNEFRNLDSSSKELMPSSKEFFGNMDSMPPKTSDMNELNGLSNSIKPTSNEASDMSMFGNKINSKEQPQLSMENNNMMSPGVQPSFESNMNSMKINKPMSDGMGNTMFFNMDAMIKSEIGSPEMNTNLNGMSYNGDFSGENMPKMGIPSSKDTLNMMRHQSMSKPTSGKGISNMGPQSMGDMLNMGPQAMREMSNMGLQSIGELSNMGAQSMGEISNMGPQAMRGMSNMGHQPMGELSNMGHMNELNKDIANMGHLSMKNNMDVTEVKSRTKEIPQSYNYADHFNTYLNNLNSMGPVYVNNNAMITNTMIDPNDVRNLNNMAISNTNISAPTLETYPYEQYPPARLNPATRVNSNPDHTRSYASNPNFGNWEKELFNSNFTKNFVNIDLKKLKPPGKSEKENRIPAPIQPPSVPTYRAMPPTGMNQGMKPGMEQKNNTPMKSNMGLSGPSSTDQSKSLSPGPQLAFPSSSHFQVAFRWKIIDLVFKNNKHKANLVNSNKFIPENNLPLGIGVWRDKIFVSFPKWKTGIPVTLASFDMNDPSESPLMIPYPNWSYFDDSNCNSLISVFRMSVDKCDRLWVMDTGTTNIISSIQQLCPPKLMVFDLKTNTLLRKYILPTTQVFEGSLFSNIATELVEDCDHAFVYVNDVFRYGLIVYDYFKNTSYRLTHPYMYPEPLQSTYILDNLKFRWVDGIFGMAISPELRGKYKRHPYEYYHYNVHHYNGTNVDKTIRDDQRYMYFHSMSSNRHYYISTTDLRNSSRYVNSSDIDEYFHYLGQRHKNTQASASAINSNGVMFYNLVTKHSVGCWNTKSKVYLPQTQDIVQTSREILNFPNDLKIDPSDNIWVLSNKLHQYLYGFLDVKVYNYRILVANSNDLVRNTKCDPYLNLNDYIHNLHVSYKQCPNNDL